MLTLTHTPTEVQFYCVDLGGGTLSTLNELPHVGGVAGRMDVERISRTIAEVQAVLSRRERLFAEEGIENMAAYRALRRPAGSPTTRTATSSSSSTAGPRCAPTSRSTTGRSGSSPHAA